MIRRGEGPPSIYIPEGDMDVGPEFRSGMGRGPGSGARHPLPGLNHATALHPPVHPLKNLLRSLAVLFFILLLAPTSTAAQEYGQWTWEALVAVGGRNRDNLVEGRTGTGYDERIYGLSAGMNGFIVHPAVSRFRLGLDLEFIDTDSGGRLDTDRTGINGNLDLFPRGPYSGSLYVNRQFYDYSGGSVDDPFTRLATPDTVTSYGARFRMKQGFLQGSLLGVERSSTDFITPDTRPQEHQREFYDWTRSTGRFSHHLRLEHRYRDIGTVDVKYDEFRVNFDERGDFTPTWHWTLSGSGVRQESETFGLVVQTVDNYQLRNRVVHDVRDRDLLFIDYEFGLHDVDTGASTESHGLAASYRWRPSPRWQFGPLATYAMISSDVQETRSSRAGLVVGWDQDGPTWNSRFTARGSYGALKREVAGMTQDESQFAGSFIGAVGHGTLDGLRKELEVEVTRNRLRITQAAPILPPGLGLPLPGLGTENVQRARLTLGHRWDAQSFNAWGDWTHRESAPLSFGQVLTTDTLTATVQYTARRFDIKANVADSDLEESSGGGQSIRTLGVLASWRPWRSVLLRGSYRLDDRTIRLAPDIDSTQIEAGIRWQIGDFYLDTGYLEIDQRILGGPETTLRTVTWKITRRFGGRLPVVTGPQRRGVIR